MARAPIGRQQLLDAARDELVRGNGVLELAALTRRAGLSTGAMYHHFGSKSGLLAAIYETFYEGLRHAIGDAHLPAADWSTREHERTRRFVAYHFADPLAAVLLDRAALDPQLTELEAVYIQTMSANAADNIRAGQARGEIPAEIDPESAGAFVIGGLRHGIGQQLRLTPPPDPETAADRLWRSTAAVLGLH
ncbi:TetR/AcrR family transcriptional regulator [Nocardia brasiliensis]|uniref:TetR/AcrR family transcriptional regulator n=1 Tax=Nocardia brasiliensis TaxID=37326 RepID=UPI0005AAE257|nr:TetR/AcrR family transcriptional regulator [Nocardia brasiliensis]